MRQRALASLGTALILVLVFGSTVSASSSHRRITLRDDCDPATFDLALQNPNACVKDGSTTFDEFIGQLLTMGQAPAWRFAPAQAKLDAGGSVDAYNEGGEAHTFSEVANFGGGCVAILDALLGLTAVPECANPAFFFSTLVVPGTELDGQPLTAGTHRFQCLIHPWMRTTIQVGSGD